MLAGCKPVWDVSSSSFTTVRTHTGFSMKLNSSWRPQKLKIKLPGALPGIIHEEVRISKSHDCCDWRGGKELGQLGQQQQQQQGRRCFITCSSTCGMRRCQPSFPHAPILHLRRTVSLLALESRPGGFKVSRVASSSLAVTLTAIATRNDVELLGLTNSEARLQLRTSSLEQDRSAADGETLRRHKIGTANKGRVPWNKGGKHSPETIQLIREKTTQAMSCPLVKAKLRQNARHPQSDETRAKIKTKLRVRWDIRKRVRGYQDNMLKDWRRCVADAARMGGLWEEEMMWNSYDVIKQQMRAEDEAAARAERSKKREQAKQAKGYGKSEEHRQKIADAIKAKWNDPEYQNKVREGMAKTGRMPRSSKRPPSRPTGKRVATSTPGVVRGPLDHGFLNAVMRDEKRLEDRHKRPSTDQDDGDLSDSEADATSSLRNRKVDLLRIVTAQSIEKSSNEAMGNNSVEESSLSSGGMGMGLPLASEMSFSKLKLRTSHSVLDYKRKEATQRAKVLMAEAERAVKNFEAGTDCNNDALECVAEIRRLMAEATQFIQAADSVNRAVDGTQSKRECSRGMSTMSSGNESKLTHVQIHPPGADGSSTTHRSGADIDTIMSIPEYDDNHAKNRFVQSDQEDNSFGMTSGKKASTSSGATDIMMFGGQAREAVVVWDGHGLFTGGESAQSAAAATNNRVPSIVGLLDGRKSRRVGVGEDRDSKRGVLFERRHKAGILSLDDERTLG